MHNHWILSIAFGIIFAGCTYLISKLLSGQSGCQSSLENLMDEKCTPQRVELFMLLLTTLFGVSALIGSCYIKDSTISMGVAIGGLLTFVHGCSYHHYSLIDDKYKLLISVVALGSLMAAVTSFHKRLTDSPKKY